MANKLDIFKTLDALDKKDYGFYDSLTDDEKKGFSAFLVTKWMSSVAGSTDLRHYYTASTNHYANKHLFDLSKHPKLQWYGLVASSPNVGKQRHEWLGSVKKTDNKIKKQLMEIYPEMKEDDIAVLSELVTNKELKDYARDCGEK